MPYRIEICPNNRATCSATVCKTKNVKILKDEMRHGVLVTIQDKQSFKYRHWGCVTPAVLHNWKEDCEMDMDLVDGYDDLPEGAQAKVKKALEEEHVDDEEWRGDLECNRWKGNPRQGMFLKKPKARLGNREDSEHEEHDTPPKESGRDKVAPDNEEEALPTKKRSLAKLAEDSEEEAPLLAKKAKRSTKTASEEKKAVESHAPVKGSKKIKKPTEEEEEEEEKETPPPVTKKSRAKKSRPDPESSESDEVMTAQPTVRKFRFNKGKSKIDEHEHSPEPVKMRGRRAGVGKRNATGDND